MTGRDGWLALARAACDAAAASVRAMEREARRAPVGPGAGGDVTMAVDRAAEEAVLGVLAASGLPMTVVSEELGERALAGGGATRVVVDPIDGSLNAGRGLPVFATSVAVAEGPAMGDVVVGVVRDHGSGEEWVAVRGRGATVDGRPVRTARPDGDGGLAVLLMEGTYPHALAPVVAALDGRVGRIRALGSLALSLCAAADGRGDALAGLGRGRTVDIAAAQLVAREAGAVVGLPLPEDLPGVPLTLEPRFAVLAARDAATVALLAAVLPSGAEGAAPSASGSH